MAGNGTIRLGFVGVGSMGQCAHLKHYAVLPDCEVVAVAELREDTARRVAARYRVPSVYRDHREMLEKEDLDGIVAVQQFRNHGTLVPELFRAGVPVLTEKPLAGSIEAGEKILQALKTSGARHLVGYNKRSDPGTMRAVEEIARLKKSGELGAMTYVRILMPAGDWQAGAFTDLIRGDDPPPELESDPEPSDMDQKSANDYFKFVNYYIHQVNLMRHLLGEPYRVSYADPSGIVMSVLGDGGVPGTIEMSPYRTTIAWQESALVAFENGYVRLELPAPMASNRPGRVEILRDPGDGREPETVVPQLPWRDSMRQQAMNFLQAVRGEPTPLCEADEALEDLRIAREYLRLWKGMQE